MAFGFNGNNTRTSLAATALAASLTAGCGGNREQPEYLDMTGVKEACTAQAFIDGEKAKQLADPGVFREIIGPKANVKRTDAALAEKNRSEVMCINAEREKRLKALHDGKKPEAFAMEEKSSRSVPPREAELPSSAASAPEVSATPVPPAPAKAASAPVAAPVIDSGEPDPYFGPIIPIETLKQHSFGDANLKVLAKSIAMACDQGNCTAAPSKADVNKILQHQFTASTAVRFGLSPKEATDPFQAIVAAGKLQVFNNKKITEISGRAPDEHELALADKLGALAVGELMRNPDKNALEVLTAIYSDGVKAAAAIDAVGGNAKMTAAELRDSYAGTYNAADTKMAVAILNGVLVEKGLPPVDGVTFRNTAKDSLDKTPYGVAEQAKTDGTSAKSLGQSVLERIWGGKAEAASGVSQGR